MAKGFVLIAGMMSIDPWLAFAGATAEGFVKFEAEKMLSQSKP